EILNQLRQETAVHTEVLDIEYKNGMEVDAKLVDLAKELHASIMTTDYNLNRVAQIEGILVLNVNELANSIKPVLLPGEELRLMIVQEGKEIGQGVGFLEDGTMVVVESADSYVNQEMDVLVTRVLQTAAGCIIFAQPKRS
ncbi:MAG: PIN domain nuclease, partial [SAR202 cluster bacterium]|nr:PIN domain nuclease [SAR202 cluster bacterium]